MKIGFNLLLKGLNILFISLAFILYYSTGGNHYVNERTIFLCLLLAIELHLFLSYAQKNRNLLLTILCFDLILYYSARVVTLLYTEYSVVFSRLDAVITNDVNHTLSFIIISNLALFTGIVASKTMRNSKYKSAVIGKHASGKCVVFFLFISVILGFPDFIQFGALAGLMSFVKFYFLNPFNTVLLAVLYLVIHSDRMNNMLKIILISLLVVQVLGLVLYSSRSAIPTIMLVVLIASLVKNSNKLYVKFSHLIISLILTVLSLFLFVFTSYIRPIVNEGNISNREKIVLLQNFDFVDRMEPRKALSPIFDRIGFLDYATEIIAHERNYSDIIRPSYYFKSIMDNVLSPGFDFFDTPKVANALSFRYSNKGELSLKNVDGSYQSDQLTMYGEYYALFGGWFSIVFFFLTGFVFQSQIQLGDKNSSLLGKIYQGIVLYLFLRFIDSFGIDWMAQNVLTLYFSYLIFKNYILKKEIALALKKNV